jgi:hypothetical protein
MEAAMLDSLQVQRTLLNAVILSLLLGNILLAALMYNARLFLHDFPKAIQEKVPPLSPGEKRDRMVLTVLFMGVLLGGLILETVQLRQGNVQPGSLSFGAAYLHVFLLLAIFNLFDALVLDLIVLTWLKPKCMIPPGAEGMEHLLYDYGKQLRDFLKGMVFCAVASLPFAAIAVL